MRVLTAILLLLVLATMGTGPPAPASGARARGADWQWPVSPVRITEPYRAPAQRYGPGHRGLDLAAPPATTIAAPSAGVVAFAGTVAGRPIVTIDHGDGRVTTLEPVTASVPLGARVRAGDAVGTIASGGHTEPGTLHFGVREDGEYVNPAMLLNEIARAVLLPCC